MACAWANAGPTAAPRYAGRRLAKMAGFKPQELMFDQVPGRGGAVSTLPSQDISLGDFTKQLDVLTRQVDDRATNWACLSRCSRSTARRKSWFRPCCRAGRVVFVELWLAHRSVQRPARIPRGIDFMAEQARRSWQRQAASSCILIFIPVW